MTDAGDVVQALSADQVCRLTGLTPRQLAYWDATGFFAPEYAADARRAPHSRIYSFRDVVGLRTISVLMNHHGVSVPHLRAVAERLAGYTDRPWSELRLRVWNRRVQFDEPGTGRAVDVLGGQYVLVPIIDVIRQIEAGVKQLQARDDSQVGQFEKHRHVSHNRLVIAGTRVPVASVLDYLDAGRAEAEILADFPRLTAADVEAVREHGRAALAA